AQLAAAVRQQQQQMQGMVADHAEELRTLQYELQLAREGNEGLKRAMGEQVLALQGALELRDAHILELEERNDRMDTVLQVIQAQLGCSDLAAAADLSAATAAAAAAAAGVGVGPASRVGTSRPLSRSGSGRLTARLDSPDLTTTT
ncbi:hypothetical protein Agub_g9893, partial [Astrephomene gubernaculifera]